MIDHPIDCIKVNEEKEKNFCHIPRGWPNCDGLECIKVEILQIIDLNSNIQLDL